MKGTFFLVYILQLCVNVAGFILSVISGDADKKIFFGLFFAIQVCILCILLLHKVSSWQYGICVFISIGFTLLSRMIQLPQFQARCPSVLHPIFVIASALFLLAGLFVFDKKN